MVDAFEEVFGRERCDSFGLSVVDAKAAGDFDHMLVAGVGMVAVTKDEVTPMTKKLSVEFDDGCAGG